MAAHWLWWILAALLIGAELLTGTFYLLAVGVAFALGGAAAWLGASMEVQLLIAGVLAVAGTVAAHQWRRRHGDPPHQPALEIGQPVQVEVWRADGTARVRYRGTTWDAEAAMPDTPRDDTMSIVGTRGSVLLLGVCAPAHRAAHRPVA